MSPTITADELRRRLTDPNLTIVDQRPIAAFNGWRLHGEPRGGHIPGAVAFPAGWLDSVDAAGIDDLLEDKRVTPDRAIVLCPDRPDQAAAFEARLAAGGHRDVRVLDGGFGAWAAARDLPVARLANHHRLVHPDWLCRVLAGEITEAGANTRFILLHANFGVPDDDAETHLPGALHLDTNRLEDPVTWNRRSPAEIEAVLTSLGITHDTTVAVYGRDTVGAVDAAWPGRHAGQMAAARTALILRHAGVGDVRLLDGGYDAWVRAGLPLETAPRRPSPVATFGIPVPRHPDYLVDLPEARAILADPAGAVLVSVRSRDEQTGGGSGYPAIQVSGRIQGDVWLDSGRDAYHMEHYRNVDGTMRAYPEIEAGWRAAGITPDKRVAFYCGTGWRAAETWFAADLLGWPRIAVYDGGWLEWSADPANDPMVVGPVSDAGA